MEKESSRGYFLYLIVFLGILNGFGPFVIDMYLPALPEMTHVFNTSAAVIQLGLTFCMVGLAVGQVVLGPISDKFGRKSVLICSLLLYVASTVGCLLSGNAWIFTVFRFLQGFGAAGGIVISRSVATDLYHGRKLAQIIALISAINGLAPIVAPLAGGVISETLGWRGIFSILLGLGGFLVLSALFFRESLPPALRSYGSGLTLLKDFGDILKTKGFLPASLLYASSMAALFCYISAAPFIIQEEYEMSGVEFSLVFAFNAIAIATGSLLSVKFSTVEKSLTFGTVLALIGSTCCLIFYCLSSSFFGYIIPVAVMLLGLGFMFPSSTTLAMESGRKFAGIASSVIGALGYLAGGLAAPLVGMGDIKLVSFAWSFVFLLSGVLLIVFCNRRNREL